MTVPQTLAADQVFAERVKDGRNQRELAVLYPDYTLSTIKRARQIVNGMPERADVKRCLVAEPASEECFTAFEGDKATFTGKTSQRIHTLQQLLDFCEFDGSEWEVERWQCNKWEVGAKGDDGKIAVSPLYQVKATFRRKAQVCAAKEEIADLIDAAKRHMPKDYPKFLRTRQVRHHLLEIAIPDLHMGKLAWGRECGENYDLNIACDLYREALADLIQKSSAYDIDRILFVAGNDLLHSDNEQNKTYAGTPQDCDGRHARTFKRTREVMIEAIDTLRPIAPVDVLVVPGNHDRTASFFLGDSLSCWYQHVSDVTVDNTPMLRKYYRYGEVMLCLTHGSEERPLSRLANIAAAEQPQMWGQTRFREAHVGHLHKTQVTEDHGFRVRILSSLCATDAWHKSQGYIGNVRSAEAFLWHRSQGLAGIHLYNVDRSGLPRETLR